MEEKPVSNPLLVLLELARRARQAKNAEELGFLVLNDSHALAPYRQAVLWLRDGGVKALSGVVQPESNAPYVHWLERGCRQLLTETSEAFCPVDATALAEAEAVEWAEWLPAHGLWFTLRDSGGEPLGGLLFAAEGPWDEGRQALMREWLDIWAHAWRSSFAAPPWSWGRIRRTISAWWCHPLDKPWWQRPRLRLLAILGIVLFFPLRLSVLAPAELVPAMPAVVRAPLDGVIERFDVTPNQQVKAGQVLFGFDQASLAARRDVAAQALATAEAEYRQFAQQALMDNKSKAQLSALLGRIEEKRTEAAFLTEQLQRAGVRAPIAGTVLFDDPTEWIGKPVQTGERVMRIAAPGDVEVEAWLSLADAIPLAPNAPLTLYLAADPLDSIAARVRYVAYDAVARPNGNYAYRVRARLDGSTAKRVGLKGTAKLQGRWVPLCYWAMRRPLASIRQTLGI